MQTLTDLMEEAEEQLNAARGKETKDLHAFQVLKLSLEDEIKYSQKEIDEAKAGIAEAGEKKSKAEGDLAVASKELASDIQGLSDLHHECMTKAWACATAPGCRTRPADACKDPIMNLEFPIMRWVFSCAQPSSVLAKIIGGLHGYQHFLY